MKTILFVLALAAAPCLFAQVATPITLFDSQAYSLSPQVALAGDRVFVAAEVADWGAVVLNVDAHGSTSQAGYVFAGGSVSAPALALGKVFYRGGIGPGTALRCSDGNWQSDHAIDGAPFGLPVAEIHGFAYGAVFDYVANQTLIWRTDGMSVDSFSVALPGMFAGMAALGDRLIVAINDGWSWNRNWAGLRLYSIDTAGAPTLIHTGADLSLSGVEMPEKVLLGALGDALLFVDVDPAGPWAQLWKTDGTAAGTQLVTGLYVPGIPGGALVHEGIMYFATASSPSRTEVWRTNGTAWGTARVTYWETHGVLLGKMVPAADAVYFATYWSAAYSLWRIAPDSVTPVLVHRDESGNLGAVPLFFAGGAIYLRGNGGRAWKFDIESRRLFEFKPQFEGAPEARLEDALAVFGDRALVTDQSGRLWRLDLLAPRSNQGDSGCAADNAPYWPVLAVACLLAVAAARRRRGESERAGARRAGTFLLVIAPALAGASALHCEQAKRLLFQGAPVHAYGAGGPRIVSHDNSRYLAASTGYGDVLLRFHPDGRMFAATPMQDVIHPDSVSVALGSVFYEGHGGLRRTNGYPHGDVVVDEVHACPVVELGGFAYYIAQWPGEVDLRRTSGAPASGRIVTTLPGQLTFGGRLYVVNGRLVFLVQQDGALRLYSSDGTAEGTTLIFSREPELAGGELLYTVMAATTDALYFEVSRSWDYSGIEWMRTDGKAVEPFPRSSIILPVGSTLGGVWYFVARWASNYAELWSSDGTPEGTLQVTNVHEHGSVMGNPQVHDGAVYVATEWGAEGSIWRVKGGLPARVYHKVDARFEGRPVLGAGGNLYLLQEDGRTLWRADVSADVARMAEIPVEFPGAPDAQIRNVLLATDDGVLVVDTMNRVWLINSPRSSSNEGGCAPGAAPGWPALAVVCLLMPVALRRRELFASQRVGAHTLLAGERRPAPRDLP